MRRHVVLAIAGIVSLGLVQGAAADPLAVAEAFCAAQMQGDRLKLRPLMTRDLAAVVEEAEARNRAIAEDGSAAPLADGVPYQSFAQPVKRCEAGAVAVASNLQLVDVTYSTPGEANGGWTDQLVLKQEDGELRIDDILFASFPTDTYKAGLRRLLRDSFDN